MTPKQKVLAEVQRLADHRIFDDLLVADDLLYKPLHAYMQWWDEGEGADYGTVSVHVDILIIQAAVRLRQNAADLAGEIMYDLYCQITQAPSRFRADCGLGLPAMLGEVRSGVDNMLAFADHALLRDGTWFTSPDDRYPPPHLVYLYSYARGAEWTPESRAKHGPNWDTGAWG